MKITKKMIRDLIKEELKIISEAQVGDNIGTSDAKKQFRQSGAKDIGAGGVSNQERGVVLMLQKQLLSLSKDGSLGPVMTLIKQLSDKLAKLGHSGKDSPPEV